MSRAARSLWVFGIYLLVLGPSLAIVPNLVLRMFGVPETDEVWIRLVGVLATNIGVYYVVAANRELRPIFQASVAIRLAVPVWLALFVLFADADPAIMIFGVADIVAALWTIGALRADRRSRP
jgi:uncharacterized membrane protein HdeD (DUF308 family)